MDGWVGWRCLCGESYFVPHADIRVDVCVPFCGERGSTILAENALLVLA